MQIRDVQMFTIRIFWQMYQQKMQVQMLQKCAKGSDSVTDSVTPVQQIDNASECTRELLTSKLLKVSGGGPQTPPL